MRGRYSTIIKVTDWAAYRERGAERELLRIAIGRRPARWRDIFNPRHYSLTRQRTGYGHHAAPRLGEQWGEFVHDPDAITFNSPLIYVRYMPWRERAFPWQRARG